MNSVNMVGRLTADPDLRYSQAGKAICKFRIAVQKFGKKDDASFFDIVCFDKVAENVANYMSKGREVSITGSLDNQAPYEKEDGTKMYPKDVIVARQVGFIGSAGGGSGQAQGQGQQGARPAQATPAAQAAPAVRQAQPAKAAQQTQNNGFSPDQIDLAEFQEMDDEDLPF